MNNKIGKIIIPLAVLILTGIMLIPFPALMMDILAALVLTSAFLAVLIIILEKKSTEFRLLPTCILVLSILGPFIQIAFTRLIMTQGEEFDGRIIRVVSIILTGSDERYGAIVSLGIFFLFSVYVAFAVGRGAVRIAKMAARFTLDSFPGKLMTIDAEYSDGNISEKERSLSLDNLKQELDFYGALDGACKFISGNFKVSILVTIVSIIGGITFAAVFGNETLVSAMSIYVPLSVANGLLAQLLILLKCTAVKVCITKAKLG